MHARMPPATHIRRNRPPTGSIAPMQAIASAAQQKASQSMAWGRMNQPAIPLPSPIGAHNPICSRSHSSQLSSRSSAARAHAAGLAPREVCRGSKAMLGGAASMGQLGECQGI